MSAIQLQLNRNLRKSILQGEPWIYRQALANAEKYKEAGLCKIKDLKNVFLAWGMYNPQGPLAVRILSLKEKPPTKKMYEGLIEAAIEKRSSIPKETDCYRLINGEGDLLPGIICDVYSKTAVLQFDGLGAYGFWDQDWIAETLLENTKCESVYFKPRHDMQLDAKVWGEDIGNGLIEVKENNCHFVVDIINGQKTGFFLDQRENRNYVKSISKDQSVLNLFSYSGGFSVYAGLGEAESVTSADVAQGALDQANENWILNNLDKGKHKAMCVDVFEHISKIKEKYGVVICDPPSLAKSEKVKKTAIQKYVETFASAAQLVKENGHLVLSSCSSHISFSDFEEIIHQALSKARKRGQILRVSGQGADHPYPHACPQMRYLKFVDLVVYK